MVPYAGGEAAAHALAIQPDGMILAGGRFELVNAVPRSNLARLHPNGRLDGLFSPGLGTDGEVLTVAIQPDGKVLVGGRFLSVCEQPRQRLARLTATGGLDTAFNPAARANGAVTRLALDSRGRILLAGAFTEVNGVPLPHLARLLPDGTLDRAFAPPPWVGSGTVRAIRVLAHDRVLIAGAFTGGIARLNADGSLDPSFSSGVTHGTVTPEVFGLDLDEAGTIWLVGHFSEVGGEPRRGVARLHPDGRLDTSFQLREQPNALPHAVLAQPGGQVLIGGWFWRCGDVERRALARFQKDGSLDRGFDAVSAFGFYGQPNVDALVTLADGRILVGLERGDSAYNPAYVITCLKPDGRLDPDFLASFEDSNVDIRTMALQADGRICLGGEFIFRAGEGLRGVARLLPDGVLDLSFQPNLGGTVRALAVQPDGKLLIGGGGFGGNAGQPYPLVRLLWDGRLDPTFARNAALPEMVSSIVLGPDGRLLIGGGSYGVNERCLARLQPDGTPDPTFVPPAFPAGDDIHVHALALTGDGKIVVGGDLGYENSPLPRTIARLHPDGRLEDSFRGAEWLGAGTVLCLAIQPDGSVLVGGRLLLGDQGQIAGLARLAPDGSLDPTFSPPLPMEPVQTLALQPDGRILIGTTSGGLQRLLPNGTLDPSFVNQLAYPGVTAEVASLVLQPDGQLLVAGSFRSVGGIPRKGLARLNNHLDPNQPDIQWSVESDQGTTLTFSPDGTQIATAKAGVAVWRAADGAPLQRISGAFGGLTSVAFCPDNVRLAAGDADGKVYVWNVWDGSRVWSQRVAGDVTSVLFTPSGTLASWSSDQTILNFWQTANGSSLAAFDGLQWSHHNVAFSPDERLFATGGDHPDYLVTLRCSSDGGTVRTLAGHTGRVRTVAFSADGSLLASGSDDSTIRLWRVVDGGVVRVFSGHTQGIWRLALAPNGTLASTSDDGTLKLWRLADGAVLRSYALGGIGGHEVEFSPDGSLLAYTSGDRLIVARNPVPAITSPPPSQTRFAGEYAEFRVGATGLRPLYFQWYREGIALAEAAGPVLRIPLLCGADAGRYAVVVSNALGTVTSREAILTVLNRSPSGEQLDPSFDPTAGGVLPGFGGGKASIRAMAPLPDGKVVIGGDFTAFNGIPRHRVARVNPDLSLDETFDAARGPNGTVEAVAWQQDGTVLIGGTFTAVDGHARSGLAKLRTDGSLDPCFRADVVNANVAFLRVEGDGRVWVGGNFVSVAGVTRRNLARLLAAGTVDQSFAPPQITGGAYDYVNWVDRLPDGRLLVGGHFESQRPFGGPDQDLVCLYPDGSVDRSFDCELSGMFLADAVLRPDGTILAGGMLHSWTGGSHYFVLAELDARGRVTREYSPDDLPSLVTSILRQHDGKALIGGMFPTAFQVPRPGLARLQVDGSLDLTFDPREAFSASAEPAVLSMGLRPDGRILVGSEQSGSIEATHALVLLGPNGQTAASSRPRLSGESGPVTALAQDADGRILVGGAFTTFNQQPRMHVARLKGDGTLDPAFSPGVSPNLAVLVLAPQPDGKLLVAGKANAANGPPPNGVLRLNPDGSVDTSFDATPTADGTCGYVRCLAVQPDGKVLIGGEFDLPPRGLARLHPDGKVDATFHPPPLPAWDEEGVHALAVLTDGRILIGGILSGLEGGPTSPIARLNPDGDIDPTFTLGNVLQGHPTAFVPAPDGSWWTGGAWLDVSGMTHWGLLHFDGQGNLTGRLDLPATDDVRPLAVEPDGHILVGATSVRRLNLDGTVDRQFRAVPNLGGRVNAALVQADRCVVLGGGFTSINGQPANKLARLLPVPPPRQPFVERQTGTAFQVRLLARPPAGTSRYAVEDESSWKPVLGISHGGRSDPATGRVLFGPFNDAAPRTLSYSVVIPPGSGGSIHFQGTSTADGISRDIVGDDSLRVWAFPPPPLWIELRHRPLSGGLVLQVWGQPNQNYSIQRSQDFGAWETLTTVSSPDGLSEHALANPNDERSFYRARAD
jgi:uncharacterized delta-60 repeat protein